MKNKTKQNKTKNDAKTDSQNSLVIRIFRIYLREVIQYLKISSERKLFFHIQKG